MANRTKKQTTTTTVTTIDDIKKAFTDYVKAGGTAIDGIKKYLYDVIKIKVDTISNTSITLGYLSGTLIDNNNIEFNNIINDIVNGKDTVTLLDRILAVIDNIIANIGAIPVISNSATGISKDDFDKKLDEIISNFINDNKVRKVITDKINSIKDTINNINVLENKDKYIDIVAVAVNYISTVVSEKVINDIFMANPELFNKYINNAASKEDEVELLEILLNLIIDINIIVNKDINISEDQIRVITFLILIYSINDSDYFDNLVDSYLLGVGNEDIFDIFEHSTIKGTEIILNNIKNLSANNKDVEHENMILLYTIVSMIYGKIELESGIDLSFDYFHRKLATIFIGIGFEFSLEEIKKY